MKTRIFGGKVYENDTAVNAGVDYLKFSRNSIEDICDWMVKKENFGLAILAEIEILIFLCERYDIDANLLIKRSQIAKWEELYTQWLTKYEKKLPMEHREEIKANGINLFNKLKEFGNPFDHF
ncbi:hypothetical protein ACYSNM_12845 [Myroides sp. LJL116]